MLAFFARAVKYGLLLNAKKTKLFVDISVFLGFIVYFRGIRADLFKIATIRDRPMPTTTTEIRAFIYVAGYLRILILNFSDLSILLIE